MVFALNPAKHLQINFFCVKYQTKKKKKKKKHTQKKKKKPTTKQQQQQQKKKQTNKKTTTTKQPVRKMSKRDRVNTILWVAIRAEE